MNVIKLKEQDVFDNLYFKPSQNGSLSNLKHSMTVLFSVCDVIYYGQYDFTSGEWTTIPGDDKQRIFLDREVQYWFYPPKSIEVFRKYADDVLNDKCIDKTSRLTEYQNVDCSAALQLYREFKKAFVNPDIITPFETWCEAFEKQQY